MNDNKKLYEDLGVEKDATQEQIKKAYRKKARKMHPDKGGDKKEFQVIAKAFAILSNEEKRKRYDLGEDIDKDPLAVAQGFIKSEFVKACLEASDNPVKDMKKVLALQVKTFKHEIKGHNDVIKRLRVYFDKILNDDKKLLSSALESKIKEAEEITSRMKSHLIDLELAVELAKNFDYLSQEEESEDGGTFTMNLSWSNK